MRCGDLGAPPVHGAAELARFGRAVPVAHVLGELVNPPKRMVFIEESQGCVAAATTTLDPFGPAGSYVEHT